MDETKSQLNKLLNQHGYPFQYSVLKRAKELVDNGKSMWLFEAAEFPAEVQGVGTRIDFMLNLKGTRIFLLAECKRVDPKFGKWCFVKAPYVRRNRTAEYCFVDHVEFNEHDRQNPCQVTGEQLPGIIPGDKAYHIGLVLKSGNVTGESGKQERDAIEKAATQVCRGVNGLIELLSKRHELVNTVKRNNLIDAGVTLVPVIFTTTRIYTCGCDLSSATLEDGKLDLSNEEVLEKDWIFYQYHISPGIKHSRRFGQHPAKFAEVLDYDYVRTIPIVAANGIDSFLTNFSATFLT